MYKTIKGLGVVPLVSFLVLFCLIKRLITAGKSLSVKGFEAD